MKKWSLITLSSIFFTLLILWIFKAPLISIMFSKDLGIPVSIQGIHLAKTEARFSNFRVKNIKKSRSPSALISKEISIKTTRKQFFQHRLTIDEVLCKDLDIYVEYYSPSSQNTNWAHLLNSLSSKETSKKNQRPYLIKKVILKNIRVILIHSNGTEKIYPTIPSLEFKDISEKTGFPLEKIEQAIFRQVIQSIFQKLGLDPLLKILSPLNLRHLIPLPF